MKIRLHVDIAVVAAATVIVLVLSSPVLLCHGNVVGVGRGNHAPQRDWMNDGVDDATEVDVILTTGNEEDEKHVVRRLRSLPSRRRVQEFDSDDSIVNDNNNNNNTVNDDYYTSGGDGDDDGGGDDGGYYYYDSGYYGQSTDAVPEYICQEIFNSSIRLPLNVSSTRLVRRNGTIGALASHNSPSLPIPIANVCGNQYYSYEGAFSHWYRVRWANSSLLFEDATDICYNVTVASFPADSTDQTYESDVLVQVYQGSLKSECASSLSCLAGNSNNSTSSRSILLSLSIPSILSSENMDDGVWIVVSTGGYIRSLPYELFVTVRCFRYEPTFHMFYSILLVSSTVTHSLMGMPCFSFYYCP
jgi:hypothetical protein